jgi:hypothetical protein
MDTNLRPNGGLTMRSWKFDLCVLSVLAAGVAATFALAGFFPGVGSVLAAGWLFGVAGR